VAKTELTEGLVKKITSDGKPDRLIADNKQANLYLRVLISGRKSWLVRARIAGRWHVETLGEWPALEVRQARLKAASALRKAMHPSAIDREKLTVKEAADQWYRDRVESRYKRPEQTKLYLDRDLKPIANKPLARVTRADVARLVAAKAPTAGNRLLAIVKQLFRYAATVEWIAADPLSVLTRSNVGTEEKPRERVLTDDEIRRAWAIPAPHGTLYRFLLASGQRLSEALALASDSSQVREGIWYIEDNKSGRPHRVPVLPLMQRLLKEGLPVKKRSAAWSLWKGQMQCDATVHDIRRTVATRMRELGASVEVIEALLNHAPPRLVRIYQRPDMTPQIADALKQWHRQLSRLVAAKG
jgi:integrase